MGMGNTWRETGHMRDGDHWAMTWTATVMRKLSRWLLATALFVLIMLGWLGDSLVSVVMRRPLLSFQEVYASWKNHLLHS